MSDGFVKLHRSFLTWEWYADEACRCLFLHLLLTVNWKPGRFMGHDIPPGCAAIGSEALARELGWNRAKLRRTLDKLKATGEVATKPASKWTLVTLVNWAKYQDCGQQTGQQNDTQTASKRPANGQQTATIEEGKKERREEGKKEEGGAGATSTTRPDLTIRRQEFEQEVKTVNAALPPERKLPDIILEEFIGYWTEPTQTARPRLRCETEKTWDTARRIGTWRRIAEEKGQIKAPIKTVWNANR